jgi:BirA family biotin operon repressor/biotin-[acetyl-CoA-carboxylase] ligase
MRPDLIRLGDVPSTMEEAHRLAQHGAVHGTAVVAERQAAGRGTRGRSWASERGGLWLSVVARPTRTDALEALSLRVGLATAAALERACPLLPSLRVKWPNDIVIDGRKLAGILCEARWGGHLCQWVVIGVGINVTNPIAAELAGLAARVTDWDPAADAAALAPGIAAAVAVAAREAGPLDATERRAYALRDALSGVRITEPADGTAEGITATGALRIRTDAGPVRELLAGVVSVAG